jgi:hypothetical protein
MNTPQDAINAWRHIVDIFRSEGANNVMWVWSVLPWPSKEFGASIGASGGLYTNDVSLNSIYPGDSYVDVIGIECYNFKDSGNPVASCAELADGIYKEASALSRSKPLMMAEMGTYEDSTKPTLKSDWFTEALSPTSPNAIYYKFPRLQSMMYWDDVKFDLAVNSSPKSLAAFKTAITNPLYVGNEYSAISAPPVQYPELSFNVGPTQSYADFLSQIYFGFLNRNADPAGYNFWLSTLVSQQRTCKTMPDALWSGVSYQAEKGVVIDNDTFVSRAYVGLFAKPVDAAVKADLVSQLQAGKTRRQVLSDILNSSEYAIRCSSLGISP